MNKNTTSMHLLIAIMKECPLVTREGAFKTKTMK